MGINPLPTQFLQFMCWVGKSMDVSLQWYKISDIVVAWLEHQYPDSLSACVTLPSVVRWKYFCNMIVQIFSCTSSASQEIHSLVEALVRGNIIAVVGKLFSSSEIFVLLQLCVVLSVMSYDDNYGLVQPLQTVRPALLVSHINGYAAQPGLDSVLTADTTLLSHQDPPHTITTLQSKF